MLTSEQYAALYDLLQDVADDLQARLLRGELDGNVAAAAGCDALRLWTVERMAAENGEAD